MRKKIALPTFLFMIGAGIAAVAVFADALGLDSYGGWGRARIGLLIIGVFVASISALGLIFFDRLLSATRNIRSIVAAHPLASRLQADRNVTHLSAWVQNYWLTFPILLLVIVVYIWFVSSGTWTTWISPTRHYANLARGFQLGNLYLPTKFNSNSLELPDPHDPHAEWGNEVPIDVSLYKGKLYLYWGPVPALLLVAINPFINGRVGDLQLVFGFICGIFLVQFILLVEIWDRYFRKLSMLFLYISILFVGLASPVTFILNSARNARIYEAAITGGQFFLMAGLLAIFAGLARLAPSRWLSVCAGISLTLAIGSRLFLALPVGFILLMVAIWLFKINNRPFDYIVHLLPLIIPLALGMVGLGWYNWARFGSVIETGIRYQWPGWNLEKTIGDFFSPGYVVQNLYNYLFHPFALGSKFPYIYIQYGKSQALFTSYSLPAGYGAQYITGLVFTLPFVVYSIPALVASIPNFLRARLAQSSGIHAEQNFLHWITFTLSGSCLSAFVLLMFYFWAAMRFLDDFMPCLLLLSVIGFWQGYQSLSHRPVQSRFYAFIGAFLIGSSIVVSILLALSI